jgi:hypothetical protein
VLADSGVFGADLLVWLVLALGAAMVVGYGLALLRPPSRPPDAARSGKGRGAKSGGGRVATSGGGRAKSASGRANKAGGTRRGPARAGGRGPARGGRRDLPEAPLGRSLVMIGIGAIAVIWSAATLLTK